MINKEITNEQNIILQSYYTVSLLVELGHNYFLDSEFFKDMKFGAPWVKDGIKQIGIDNQGSAIMALYAMLVLPRELIFESYSTEYNKIDNFLSGVTKNTQSTYESDTPRVEFLRHIRNAVSHGRIQFNSNVCVIFKDEYNGKSFSTELPLISFGEFIQRLQEIHLKYIKDANKA